MVLVGDTDVVCCVGAVCRGDSGAGGGGSGRTWQLTDLVLLEGVVSGLPEVPETQTVVPAVLLLIPEVSHLAFTDVFVGSSVPLLPVTPQWFQRCYILFQ